MAMKQRRRTRRRTNPMPVIFANPRKPRRRRRRRSNPGQHRQSWLSRKTYMDTHPAKKRRKGGKKRRRHHARPARSRRRRRYRPMAVFRKRGRKIARVRKAYRRSRGGRMRLVKRLYRRSNPLSVRGIGSLIRPAFFGGLGVVTARIGKHLYQKYLSSKVAGDGSSSIRGYLNEALGLASMAVMTIGVEKGLKKVPGVRYEDCTAFRYGGLAETGRQMIGVIVKKVRPSTDMATWGLDGRASNANPYSGIGERTMGELEDADSFMGNMGELEDADSFQGAGGPFVIRN